MKLLLITQKVDTDDSVLGFMHRWIEVFSGNFEHIQVICLEAGKHHLPNNVEVFSLGKESGGSRIRYVFRFFKMLWGKLGPYDAVFVHMNQEYVLLGGWWWLLRGAPIYLWRNHAQGSLLTRLAGKLSRKVFYTSPQSFTATFDNAVQMPVGVDTEKFVSGNEERNGVLILGRIDPVKRVLEMVDVASQVANNHPFTLTIVGSPSRGNEAYAKQVEEKLKTFPGQVVRVPAVSHGEAVTYFQKADILLNFTEAGSFDKVIFEAAACGTLLLTTNEGLEASVPSMCLTNGASAKEHLQNLLTLAPREKDLFRQNLSGWVEKEHSLRHLSSKFTREVFEK